MSTLIVEVCEVEEIKPHPNADKVELICVKGWQCVSGIGYFKVGEKCVYFPPDSVVPEHVAELFEITKYCNQLPKNLDGTRPPGLRIKAQRFRGEPSFGTVQKPCNPEWPIGHSVIEHYGVTKYEPPMRTTDGDAAPPVSAFHKYVKIEHISNFPQVLVEGEEVVITEKLHGCLSKDTKVMLANGEEVPISEIRPGNHVLSLSIDDEKQEFVPACVESVIVQPIAKEWVKLTFDNDEELICTTDHLIYTHNGWKKAGELTEIDDIYTI